MGASGGGEADVHELDPQSLPAHVDRLYRAAWALCGSRADAEDLVQETFARVLSGPRMLRGRDELAYLLAALRNTYISDRRRDARRPLPVAKPIEDLPLETRDTGLVPEAAFEASEVLAAIARLPEDFRMALIAVDIVGLTYAEAAVALGTREATITTRIYRARQQVSRRLSPQRVGLGAAESEREGSGVRRRPGE
jgi:RNA polymerase sigma-70 factor (ECF subfamily)